MPKKCVEKKMKQGMSKDAAVKVCYPNKSSKKTKNVKSIQKNNISKNIDNINQFN